MIIIALKHSILQVLEDNRDKSISGQQLADKLSVSRTAIWKAVKELEKEGYQIHATNNKGYQLEANTDLISSEGILPKIDPKHKLDSILVHKTIDSTNVEAKKLAVQGANHGTVVISEGQEEGRGRLGRKFYSPSKTGIYMSVILRPKLNVSNAVLITTAAAVAVCRAIEILTDVQPVIKWVNDIYVNNKKICGILTEAISDFESGSIDSIIIGIGINFTTSQDDFPEEIRSLAGSLFPTTASDITRNHLIAEILNQLLELNVELQTSSFLSEYKTRSMILGKQVMLSYNNTTFTGKAIDFDKFGGLIVETSEGFTKVFHSGEISLRTA